MVVLNRIKRAGLPEPLTEYVFCPGRKWRFDFCWNIDLQWPFENINVYQRSWDNLHKVAIEWEGGIFSGGRHVRPLGFIGDCQKYNRAVLMGWKILRYHSKNLDDLVPDLQKLLNIT